MVDHSRSEPLPAPPEERSYLFSAAGPGSPLEELRAFFEKKFRTAQNLGEKEKARAYQEAYELARKRLGASLGMESDATQG